MNESLYENRKTVSFAAAFALGRARDEQRERERERERESKRGGLMGERSGSGSSSSSRRSEDLVETGKADRAVWLMKCPPLVSRSWLPHQNNNNNNNNDVSETTPPPPPRQLAKVVLSLDPLHETSSPQFTMEMAGANDSSGNAPKLYALDMSKDLIPMCVFSSTNQGRISVEGKVLNKFDMKPHNTNIANYRKLCRERTNKYNVKTRQVQVITDDRGVHMRPMPGMMGSLISTSKEKKKAAPTKGSDTKRTRRDRGEMETIMFKLFERQPNWTLRQLIVETDQPEQFLKDILKDLCVYNNKGTHQGTYELKPEYKKTNEEGSSK